MALYPLKERLRRHRKQEVVGGRLHQIGIHLRRISVGCPAFPPAGAGSILKVDRTSSACPTPSLSITFDLGGFLHLSYG